MKKINKKILENAENPIVKRALKKRCSNFMFNYGDVHHDGPSTTSEREKEKTWNRKRGEGKWDEDGYTEYNESLLYKEINREGGYDVYNDIKYR